MLTSYFTELAFKTFTIFDNLFKVNNDKNFIIDPLTCMIRLAMLSFKESGTKISIFDKSLEEYSLNTVQMFFDAASSSGYEL